MYQSEIREVDAVVETKWPGTRHRRSTRWGRALHLMLFAAIVTAVGGGCSLLFDDTAEVSSAVADAPDQSTDSEAVDGDTTGAGPEANADAGDDNDDSAGGSADEGNAATESNSDDEQAASASANSATTTAVAAPPAEPSSATEPELDGAEPGLRYDIGRIARWSSEGGSLSIVFDRYQSIDGTQGVDWTDEPSNLGASDAGYLNQSERLRQYPIAPSAEARVADDDWLEKVCANERPEPEPLLDVPVQTLLENYSYVSLAFDDQGRVVRLTDQRAC